jgi:hypothetical protein
MFSWDGKQQRFILVDDFPLAVSDVGILVSDEAPPDLRIADLLPDQYDSDQILGWIAVIPVGETPAVLMMETNSMDTEMALVRVAIGPDPYQIPGGGEADIIDSQIVHIATEAKGSLLKLCTLMCASWKKEVTNRQEVMECLAMLAALPVAPIKLPKKRLW